MQLATVVRWIGKLPWIVWGLILVKLPMLLLGQLPGSGTMAAESISSLLLAACYAAFYACGNKLYLRHYLSMLVIPMVTLTRGPMVAMLSIMPLTPAPFPIKKRFVLLLFLAAVALVLFETGRFQSIMFHSGGGTISDLSSDKLQTSGRFAMWEVLWGGVQDAPWFGHGMNSSRERLFDHGFPTYLPHNDWLKIWHDFGLIGVICYSLTLFLQGLRLVRIAKGIDGPPRLLAYAAAAAFIPYAVIMFTDNVILYIQYFGNLHFCLIGLVYGHLKAAGKIAHLRWHANVFRGHPALQQRANG
jgi:O-antigen ligase